MQDLIVVDFLRDFDDSFLAPLELFAELRLAVSFLVEDETG